MRLRVDLTPNPPYGDELVVVVDVLRATTSIGMLLEAGAREVWVTRSTRAARERAGAGDLLLGEKEGLPPEGFHYGTSPAALEPLDVRGKRVFYTSDHLPAALESADRSEGLWLASLRNAPALVERLHAENPARAVLVCAGFRGAEALDDALAAGLIVRALAARGRPLALGDAARLSASLPLAFPGPLEALVNSASGRFLSGMGFEADLVAASRVGADRTVPVLSGSERAAAGRLYRFIAAP